MHSLCLMIFIKILNHQLTQQLLLVLENIMENEDQVQTVNTVNHSDSHSRFQQRSNSIKQTQSFTNDKQEPTEEQLCQTIILMKQQMNGRSLQKAIEMMYDFVVKKKPPEKVFCDYVPPLLHIPQAHKNYYYRPRQRKQIILTFDKNELLQTHFNSELDELKYKEKRLIAKSFVAQGYGWEKACQEFLRARISSILSKQNYKQIIKNVAAVTFRKIQKFLKNQCGIRIKFLEKQQLAKVISFVLSQKASNYGHVFKIFLRWNYGLSKVTLNEVEIVHFYLEIMKFLHNKKLTVEGVELLYSQNANSDRLSETKTVTNSQEILGIKKTKLLDSEQCSDRSSNKSKSQLKKVDELIVQSYKTNRSLRAVKRQIFLQFGWRAIKIKQRFVELIKEAITKTSLTSKKQSKDFPQLSSLSNSQIQKILYLKDLEDLRINLLDNVITAQQNIDDLFLLVEMINESKELLHQQNMQQVESIKDQSQGEENSDNLSKEITKNTKW